MLTWLNRVRLARMERFATTLRRRHAILQRPTTGQLILETVGIARRRLTLLNWAPRPERDRPAPARRFVEPVDSTSIRPSWPLAKPEEPTAPAGLRPADDPAPALGFEPLRWELDDAVGPPGPVADTAGEAPDLTVAAAPGTPTPEPADVSDLSDVGEVSDVGQVGEVSEVGEVGEVSEVSEVNDVTGVAVGSRSPGPSAPSLEPRVAQTTPSPRTVEPLKAEAAPMPPAPRPALAATSAEPPNVDSTTPPVVGEAPASVASTTEPEPVTVEAPWNPVVEPVGRETAIPVAQVPEILPPAPAPEPSMTSAPTPGLVGTAPSDQPVATPIADQTPTTTPPPVSPALVPEPTPRAEPAIALAAAGPEAAAPSAVATSGPPPSDPVSHAESPRLVSEPGPTSQPPVISDSLQPTPDESVSGPAWEPVAGELIGQAAIEAEPVRAGPSGEPVGAEAAIGAQPTLPVETALAPPSAAIDPKPPAPNWAPVETRQARSPGRRPERSLEHRAGDETRSVAPEPAAEAVQPAGAAAASLPIEPPPIEPPPVEESAGPMEWLARLQAAHGPLEVQAPQTPAKAPPQGQPLSIANRELLEPLIGIDVGSVRVHQGAEAAEATGALQADALAVGEQIVLGPGHQDSDPKTVGLLGHELLHVARQRTPRFVPPILRGMPRPVQPGRPPFRPSARQQSTPRGPGQGAPSVTHAAEEEAMALVVEAAAIAASRDRTSGATRGSSPPPPVPATEILDPHEAPIRSLTPADPEAPPRWGTLPAPWEPLPDLPPSRSGPVAEVGSAGPTSPSAPAGPWSVTTTPPPIQAAGADRQVPDQHASAPTGPAAIGGAPKVDLDTLAKQVYTVLKRRLAGERRRAH